MPVSSAAILGSTVLLPGTPAHACRDTSTARWWARPLSRWLAAREARALAALAGIDGIPTLLDWDGQRLLRTALDGCTLCTARPRDPGYFRAAHRLLGQVHRRGIAHNDLAREPNWLVRRDGRPGLIDFQLAWRDARRGRLFRLMAREDLRHLLKHKRCYCPQHLTARERRLLAAPSAAALFWRWTLHPLGRTLRRWLAPR